MTCTLRSALTEKHSREGRHQAKESSCKLQRCSPPQRLTSLSVLSVHGLVFGHLIPRWSELTSSMACKAWRTSESPMFQSDPSRRAGYFACPVRKCVDCSYEFSKSRHLGPGRFLAPSTVNVVIRSAKAMHVPTFYQEGCSWMQRQGYLRVNSAFSSDLKLQQKGVARMAQCKAISLVP